MSTVPTPWDPAFVPTPDQVEAVWAAVPAIAGLDDPALGQAVAATWAASLAASPFSRIEDVPQSPVIVDRPLLAHVNEVNDLALSLMDLAGHYGLTIDRDLAVATAILHDVDKPLIFRRDAEGAFATAPGTSLGDHGAIGALLARRHGVPDAVAELVRRHSSFASDGLPGTAEGTIIHYADLTSNDLASVQHGVPPVHSSVRMVPKTTADPGTGPAPDDSPGGS
jgi:putative nucleotidyltransferase with HDIG domain